MSRQQVCAEQPGPSLQRAPAGGRAGEHRGSGAVAASAPRARSSAVPAAHPEPGLCGRPPLTYRLKTREGFRRGVAALSPDTAAERPAAVGERLPPRVGWARGLGRRGSGQGAGRGRGPGRAGPRGQDR